MALWDGTMRRKNATHDHFGLEGRDGIGNSGKRVKNRTATKRNPRFPVPGPGRAAHAIFGSSDHGEFEDRIISCTHYSGPSV